MSAARSVIALTYLSRPWSSGMVQAPRPAGYEYDSIDPHGFGLVALMISALVFALPVFWLLFQRRPATAIGSDRPWWRSTAALLAIGTPMLMLIPYLRLSPAYGWPVIVSSALWFALVAASCGYRGTKWPSVHAAFDRSPRLAWGVVIALAAAKFSVFALAVTQPF